jgi:tetratricopeptide (TPR) repeat protein
MVLAVASAMAQSNSESDNYKRGLECIQNENAGEALEYFSKDLQDNDKNGYSYAWIAMIYTDNGQYSQALDAANMAVKYIPKEDHEYTKFAYTTRAKIYYSIGDTAKTLEDYTAVISLCPEIAALYPDRAEVYYQIGKYDLSDADYLKFAEMEPGNVVGYMGLGRNANAQGRWSDAVKQFDHAATLAKDYSSAYSFRAESYMGLEKWEEATNDIITALTLDWDMQAISLIGRLNGSASDMMTEKLCAQAAKDATNQKWSLLLGLKYEKDKQYAKAIEAFGNAAEIEPTSVIYQHAAQCQYTLGLYGDAVQSIDKGLTLEMDSADFRLMKLLKAANLYELNKPDQAISELNEIIALWPNFAYGYYLRGQINYLCGNMDAAVENLNTAITLNPKDSRALLYRCRAYTRQGKPELAKADYRKIMEQEEADGSYNCIPYAYLALGQKDKATAAMDAILARNTTDMGSYYDAACLYSKMQDKDKALACLAKVFELGFCQFVHLDNDDDMGFLRNTEEFKALVGKYKK